MWLLMTWWLGDAELGRSWARQDTGTVLEDSHAMRLPSDRRDLAPAVDRTCGGEA